MGGRVTEVNDAVKFADIFLNTPFSADEERHIRRVQMLKDIEDGCFNAE
jgi:ribose 5-phosphate isomerase RpiB